MSDEHIARISYGKDSLKMLEVIRSRGLPLDRITTTDVWATDTISANLPQMDAFKARMDQWIWDNYRIEVEHLCARNPDGSKRTYEQMFYHVPQRRSQSVLSESTGVPSSRPNGFPAQISPWCRKLKIDKVKTPFLDGPIPQRASKNIVEYIGIAADEPKRFSQLNDKKRAPLVEFGIEEECCGLYCKYNNILSPSYETSFRDGCWFCHNQGVDQLRILRRNHPNLWNLLMKWDLDSPVSFKADGHTVHDFDERFRMEDLGMVPTDNTFRWKMLEEPPKFVAWECEQITFFNERK